ncbi:MAG TPA: MlaD family protein [Polyangiaceae bacterium]|jgi:phospholipid/cholesterol/gamma-HCH transport system substrate-binding protein
MATSKEVKVGAFVLAGLTAIGAVIFLIGDERQLFQHKETFDALFEDVQGLRRGSPVRMGGVDVGAVMKVDYGGNEADKNVRVEMSIVSDEARRIRMDSVATIAGKGLLGDKMIVITVGASNKAAMPPGSVIPSKNEDDVTQIMSKLGTISVQVEKVVTNLEHTTSSLADEKFQSDIHSSVASLSGILGSLDHGDGYASKLLHDPNESQKLSQTLTNLEQASAELDRTAQSVNQILARVNQGPGFAHEVIYGEDGAKALAQVGNVAGELGTTLKGIREGNGLARSVIYGDDASQQMMANLNQMTGDMRQIAADVRAGKGTLGALLVDPSVYEDLKMVLGNVERNKTLRALVRYSIRRDEKQPGVEVRDPEPPKSRPGEEPAAQSSTAKAGE